MMMNMLKVAGKWGSILAVIALLILALKQLIAFVGFLTFAIKAILVLGFLTLVVLVGYMIFKAWSDRKKEEREI